MRLIVALILGFYFSTTSYAQEKKQSISLFPTKTEKLIAKKRIQKELSLLSLELQAKLTYEHTNLRYIEPRNQYIALKNGTQWDPLCDGCEPKSKFFLFNVIGNKMSEPDSIRLAYLAFISAMNHGSKELFHKHIDYLYSTEVYRDTASQQNVLYEFKAKLNEEGRFILVDYAIIDRKE